MDIPAKNAKVAWEIPDWRREKPRRFWDPGRRLLKAIRDYQAIQRSKNPIKSRLKDGVWLDIYFGQPCRVPIFLLTPKSGAGY